jgi:hypothetical protein
MKKFIKIFVIVFVIIFIGIQFIRPNRTNPISDKSRDVSYYINIPGNVKQILERSCYDCHSNLTKWPWYTNISPASWLVAYDVNEGREHMNFSEWGTYNITDQIDYLDNINKQVKKGDMPLSKYLLLHSDAKLTDAERELVCKWAIVTLDSLLSK